MKKREREKGDSREKGPREGFIAQDRENPKQKSLDSNLTDIALR